MYLDFVGRSSHSRPTNACCSNFVHGEQRKKKKKPRAHEGVKAGGELGKKGVDDLATSLAGKTGRAPPTATHGVGAASGGLLPLYRALLSTGNGMGEAV